MRKKALIAANFIGFLHFLWHDIDMLKELGYEIYCTGDNENQEEHTLKMLEERGVTFIDIRIDSKSPFTSKNLNAFKQYAKLIKKEKFNLIHCHTPIVGLFVRLAAWKSRRNGTKIIYTTHGLAYNHLSTWKETIKYKSIEGLASRLCDAIITINTEDFNNVKNLHCKNVYLINGVGVDTQKYINVSIDRENYRNSLGISNNKILILAIGELSIRKNHSIIIEAISKLPDKSKYVYAICGRKMTAGGTQERLLQLAKELDVDVRLLGFRADIPQIVHCCDIGVIPSIREGLGLAGIQTLCAGVPIIGSNVQGIKEYVINGKTGILCNPYDVEGFAEAIIKLSDSQLRASMHDDCISIAKTFDSGISIEQRWKIYKNIIG